MITKFKIGDRVRCIHDDDNKNVVNQIGTVVNIKTACVGVNFDADVKGHAMSGMTKSGHGWFLLEKELVLINDIDPKIVITFTYDKTIAKLLDGKVTIAKAVAKCSKDDHFDPIVGAQIALQRLAEKQGSKLVVNTKMFKDVEVI